MSEEFTAPETGAEQSAAPQPVETPVVEAQVAPEAPVAEEAPPQESKAKERLSLRFSELTSQREAAKQEAERQRREAEYWRQQALAAQQPQEPAYGDYDDQGGPVDFDSAIERALEAREQKRREQEAQNAFATQVQSLRTTLLESGLDGAALIASGAEDIPFTRPMFDALAVSEHPAALADHLGRNPTEAARIAGLTPAQQGVELARLEARLASQPRTTSAPPPPSTVGARAVASSDPTGMTMEQYIAARASGKI